MRKGLIIWFLLVFLVFTVSYYYIFYVSQRQHLSINELSSLVPSQPLVYVQCSELQTRLEQLTQHPHYQQFLDSPFFQQLQTTEEWQEFSASFEAFWKEMVIDPMRLIGTDVSIGLYQTEKNELWPSAILLSRVDQIAKITERGLYIFDQLFGQLGMDFVEKIEAVPVYKVQHEEMLLPIYYAVIDNLGLVSTSFPLLQDTIQRAIGQDEKETEPQQVDFVENSSLFPQVLHSSPDSRVLALYLELSSTYQEFSTNPFLRSLNLAQELRDMADFPPISIFLDSYADHIRLKAKLHSSESAHDQQAASDFSSLEKSEEKTGEDHSCSGDKDDWGEFPIVGQVNKDLLAIFFQKLHTLFPGLEWRSPFQGIDLQQDVFGKRIACRLSNTLFGTLYTVPDLLCLSETPEAPQTAIPVLEKMVGGLLAQSFSPMARRTMLQHTSESYLETVISKVQLMFQEIFSYTVFAVDKQRSFMLFTTNSEVIKRQIDQHQAYPNESLYPCMTTPAIPIEQTRTKAESDDLAEEMGHPIIHREISAGRVWIQSERLATFIEDLMKTTTFSLLVPQQNYPVLYQQLPKLLLLLQALPPLFLEFGLLEERLFVALWVESGSQE